MAHRLAGGLATQTWWLEALGQAEIAGPRLLIRRHIDGEYLTSSSRALLKRAVERLQSNPPTRREDADAAQVGVISIGSSPNPQS